MSKTKENLLFFLVIILVGLPLGFWMRNGEASSYHVGATETMTIEGSLIATTANMGGSTTTGNEYHEALATFNGNIQANGSTFVLGGSIDGTPIGNSTRSTGKFTTLSANGAADFQGTSATSLNVAGVTSTGNFIAMSSMSFFGEVHDSSNSAGIAGQLLASNGTGKGTTWTTSSGGAGCTNNCTLTGTTTTTNFIATSGNFSTSLTVGGLPISTAATFIGSFTLDSTAAVNTTTVVSGLPWQPKYVEFWSADPGIGASSFGYDDGTYSATTCALFFNSGTFGGQNCGTVTGSIELRNTASTLISRYAISAWTASSFTVKYNTKSGSPTNAAQPIFYIAHKG